MTTYNEMTVDQSFQAIKDKVSLSLHIQSENAKTRAWVAEDSANRWATTWTEEVSYWHEMDIFTVDQFLHSEAASEHYETFKEFMGYKPRGMDYSRMTTEEINEAIISMVDQHAMDIQRHSEWNEFHEVVNAEHAAYEALWANPLPTRFESLALAYGIAA